jgi:hypothetical protein
MWQNLISHFTDLSLYERSEEIQLRVTCEWPYILSNENGDCKAVKVLLNALYGKNNSIWPKKSKAIFIISLYIHDTCLLLVIGFPQISYTVTYQLSGGKRDLILIRLHWHHLPNGSIQNTLCYLEGVGLGNPEIFPSINFF